MSSLRREQATQPRRIAMLSVHTSPLEQPGTGDAGGMNVYVLETARRLAERGTEVEVFTRATSGALPREVEAVPGVLVRHVVAGPGLLEGRCVHREHRYATRLCCLLTPRRTHPASSPRRRPAAGTHLPPVPEPGGDAQ